MSWIKIITGVLQIAGLLTEFLRDRQLIEAGEAKAVANGLANTFNEVSLAQEAARALRSDPDWAKRVRDNNTRQ